MEKCVQKGVLAGGYNFCRYFSSFCATEKCMLVILKINVKVDMILIQTMDKLKVSCLKLNCFVLGDITLGVPMTSSNGLHRQPTTTL